MTHLDRRSVLKRLTTGVVLAGGVGTAAAGGNGNGNGGNDGDTIVDVAIAVDGFDVLVAAVQEAGLVDTLSGNRQLTVFAPTDAAFNDIDITEDNVDEVDGLAGVLKYHVTPGRRKSQSVVNAKQLPTLTDEFIAVDGTTLNDGQAEIVETDIEASNGYIHVIDGVLSP